MGDAAGAARADDRRMRLALLALAATLAAAAPAAAAPKPSNIYLFHVTHVTAQSEVRTTDGAVATTKIDLDLPNKGWRGKRNAGFWGDGTGWGSLSAPFRDEPWTITRPWREEKYVQDEEKHEMYIEETICTKTATVKGRGLSGSFGRKGKRDHIDLVLPGPPFKLPCATEFDWPGFDAMDEVRIELGRRQMARKRTKIAFEHSETRTGTTVTWKGEVTVEKGYQCTVPPDYPCHTMLM